MIILHHNGIELEIQKGSHVYFGNGTDEQVDVFKDWSELSSDLQEKFEKIEADVRGLMDKAGGELRAGRR